MDNSTPQIAFTFPIRWLDDPEDRKFLKENLVNLARGANLQLLMHDRLVKAKGFFNSYAVVLKTHAYQPVKIKLTQAQIDTIFKELFGGARCGSFESIFVQTVKSTSLPVLELEIYY